MKTTQLILFATFLLTSAAFAVDPPPDEGYPNQNTAEGADALFSLTTGGADRTMGVDAHDSNTTGSDNAPATLTLIWKIAGSLNTASASAELCTTRRPGPELPQAVSTTHAFITPRCC